MSSIKTTSIGEHYKDIILTAGMVDSRGHQVFGVFESVEDAKSQDADNLAIATLGRNVLTEDQVAIAEANSDALVSVV